MSDAEWQEKTTLMVNGIEYVRRDRLTPLSSWSRRWNDDGSLSCNHGDSVDCTLTGHTTIILYELREAAFSHPPTEGTQPRDGD